MPEQENRGTNNPGPIVIKNGRYFAIRNDRGQGKELVRISNFFMDILYFISGGTNDSKRICMIENIFGDIETFELLASEMTLSKFKAITRSKGKFSFTGTMKDFDHIIADCQIKELEATEIENFGYQPGSGNYAFINGILTADGKFIKVNEHRIVKVNRKWFYLPVPPISQKKLIGIESFPEPIYLEGTIDFASWFEQVYHIYGIKGVVGICYAFISLFRDVVADEFGFFPILFLYGEENEVASSFIEQLLSLFGNTGSSISLTSKSTEKAFVEVNSQCRNSLLYYSDFTISDSALLSEFFKHKYPWNRYDHFKSTQQCDQILNGIILGGDELPSKNSKLYETIILLDCSRNRFNKNENKIYHELLTRSHQGLTQILSEMLCLRKLMERDFDKRYKNIFQRINTPLFGNIELEKRTNQNIALFLAAFSIIDTKFKISQELPDIHLEIQSFLNKQPSLWIRPMNLQAFWQTVEYLADTGKIKSGKDFIVKNEGNKRYLYIKLHPIYLLYLKYRKSEKKPPLKKSPLLRLIKTDPSFIKSGQKGRVDTHTEKNVGSSYKFDYDTLDINMQKLW